MSSLPTYTVVDQFDEDEFPDVPAAPAALLAAALHYMLPTTKPADVARIVLVTGIGTLAYAALMYVLWRAVVVTALGHIFGALGMRQLQRRVMA
jgi:hypothetical protein